MAVIRLSLYALVIGVAYVVYKYFTRPKPPAPYPPGPKPVPVLGNVFDLTGKELWLVATKWAKQYGPVTYLSVAGQGLVFLNTPEAVNELLDKRGAIYSDKPHLTMASELCGCKNILAFARYGDFHRRQRTLFEAALGQKQMSRYHPLMERRTQLFLRQMFQDPAEYIDHIRFYGGGLALSVVYGYQVEDTDDKFLTLGHECVKILSNGIASGGGIWPVDIFPALQNIPSWMPGGGFKRKAAVWKAKMEEFADKPFEWTKGELDRGTAIPSFLSTLLPDIPPRAKSGLESQQEHDLRWASNSMYSAIIDPTIATVSNFLLAMVQHPEVLERAQAEIDSVVGNSRLPSFADRASLPFCDAVFSETLRWGSPVPLALPHRLTQDDVYDGMYLPEGTLVIGNSWAIMRDENMYPEPHRFNPDRFMNPPVDEATKRRLDPRSYVFGYGRRRCPGNHLVNSAAWSLIVSIMATCKIGKYVDENGIEQDPVVDYNDSIIRLPDQFKLSLKPRTEKIARLVNQDSEI